MPPEVASVMDMDTDVYGAAKLKLPPAEAPSVNCEAVSPERTRLTRSVLDEKASALPLGETTPSASARFTPDTETAAAASATKKAGGLLLRLFESESFDSYFHMYYLFHREEQGIHDYLVNLLYRRPDEEIHFYLPQLCQLAIYRQESALPRFLLDKSARSMHLALKGNWLFQAALEDRIPSLSENAKELREEMEMAVVNSKPFSSRDPTSETSGAAVSDANHKTPDLFLRRRVVRMLMRCRAPSARPYTDKAISLLLKSFPPIPAPERKEGSDTLLPPMETMVVDNVSKSPTLSPEPTEAQPSTETAVPSFSAPSVDPDRPQTSTSTETPPQAVAAQLGRTAKKKGRVAAGFVTSSGPIVTEGSKVKFPSIYYRLGTPFNYSSFSRESHGSLLDDSEMQQFIIKQRRCEYFNLVGIFINLMIELSDKVVTEPDRERRTPLVRNCLKSVDEWLLCRRSIVAASEGIFAMTGVVVPFTHFGVEPERATIGAPTPFLVQATPVLVDAPSQFSSVQILRVVTDQCRVFSSKKRAPFLFVFELADLDEDLRDLDVEALQVPSRAAPSKQDDRPCTTTDTTSNIRSPLPPNAPRGRSAGDSKTLTWDSLTVYSAILQDLKNRELFIPPFLTRPLTIYELNEIENPNTRDVSCAYCNPSSEAERPPLVETGTAHKFPMACPVCEGTRIFYQSIKRELMIATIRRSLGVNDRSRGIEGYRQFPNVPPQQSKRIIIQKSRESELENQSLRSVIIKPTNNPPASARSLSTGRSKNGEQSVDRDYGRRSSSIPPTNNRQSEVASESRSLNARKSTTGSSGGGLNTLANMLAFGTKPTPQKATSVGTLTPAKSSPGLRESDPSEPLGFAPTELFIIGESPREQALRVRRALWGELWDEKRERIRLNSPYGKLKSWQLGAVLVKGGDDVRQELLASQLIRQIKAIFDKAKLQLWLRPYEILVTGSHSGIIEFVADTQSFDAIKKQFNVDTIAKVFEAAFADDLYSAKRKFIESHAAYSLVGYFLQVKDRHNGNLLLTANGRIVHIDYGFMLANTPGYVNFETSPFKLSAEILSIMDGETSENFEYFKELVIKGFLEARKHADRIFLLVEMMLSASKMPCFNGAPEPALQALKDRFMLGMSDNQCMAKVLDLVDLSVNNWRTAQYDNFQRLTNGIV